MATINNSLSDSERAAVNTYLREYGYADLAEWAQDSDYYWSEGEWYSDAPFGSEDDSPVDLETECYYAIEAAGEAQDEQRYGFF